MEIQERVPDFPPELQGQYQRFRSHFIKSGAINIWLPIFKLKMEIMEPKWKIRSL